MVDGHSDGAVATAAHHVATASSLCVVEKEEPVETSRPLKRVVQVQIIRDNQKSAARVVGYIYGAFATHHPPKDETTQPASSWTVTHWPTGLAVTKGLKSLSLGMRLAQVLMTVQGDWNFSVSTSWDPGMKSRAAQVLKDFLASSELTA